MWATCREKSIRHMGTSCSAACSLLPRRSIFSWYATAVAIMPVDLKPPDKPPPDRDGLWTVFVFTLITVGVASAYYLWNNAAP